MDELHNCLDGFPPSKQEQEEYAEWVFIEEMERIREDEIK